MQLIKYLYSTHSLESAQIKSDEILALAMSLDKLPYRGIPERKLDFLGVEHRYLIYQITSRKSVKIIYLIDDDRKRIFITDFFGSEMDDSKIVERYSGES